MLKISANFTCTKCKATFRAAFPDAKLRGCNCGAQYESLTHQPVVVVDSRETRSGVVPELQRLGMETLIVELDVGDYIVSERMGFERKTPQDLLQDWIDNHGLFTKVYDLHMAYRRAILLLEGYKDELFELRMIDPVAVEAMIDTLAGMGVPMLETFTAEGTAKKLAWFAHREQREKRHPVALHGKRSHFSPDQMLVYLTCAIPNIGQTTAISLLEQFKTIEALAGASIDDLMCVEGIGKKTAASVKEIMTRKYKGGNR